MKTVITIIIGLLLSVCVTVYGPSGMARAGGGAVFSIELCADGAETTILIDADGNPIEPAPHCLDCLTCCFGIDARTPANCCASPTLAFMAIKALAPSVQSPVLNTRYKFPAPRGPPAVHFDIVNLAALNGTLVPVFSQEPRRDGRPSPKDADA